MICWNTGAIQSNDLRVITSGSGRSIEKVKCGSQLIMVVVEEAFCCRVLDLVVYALNLAIRPRMVRLDQGFLMPDMQASGFHKCSEACVDLMRYKYIRNTLFDVCVHHLMNERNFVSDFLSDNDYGVQMHQK